MNFIKNIFDDKVDDSIHRQFVRFGKGNFENKAITEVKIIGKGIKIKTSFEFANEFVRFLANTINGKSHLTGGIITSKDLKNQLGFEISHVKQFAGVKTFHIDTEVSKEELIKAMNDFPDALFCLSFSTEYGSLKTKVKSPKSAKPGKGNADDVKADYCVFTAKDIKLKEEFAFDVQTDFKKFKAMHDFLINDIIVPKEYENDFTMVRVHAKRKGKIIRHLDIDGKKEIKEHELFV